MPRPKRPKPVRTVPSKLRASKQAPNQPEKRISPSSELWGTPGTITNAERSSKVRKGNEEDNLHEHGSTSNQNPKHAFKAKQDVRTSVSSCNNAGLKDPDARSLGSADEYRSKARSRTHLTPDLQTFRQANGRRQPSMGANSRGGLHQRLQGTPLAQSSLLGALQFKKRARQPSLLHQSRQTSPSSLNDLDVRDFEPDDESTPLIKALSRSDPKGQSPASHGSRKRKLVNAQVQVERSQELQEHGYPASNASSLETESFDLPPDDEADIPAPSLPRRASRKTPSPQIFNDTLAPPESSSSPTKVSPRAAGIEMPAGRRQRRVVESQNRGGSTKPRKKPGKAVPLSTAKLQNLLPRRRLRQKRHGSYDVPSSSDTELDATKLGEDEDELSFHASTKLRRSKDSLDHREVNAQRKSRKAVDAKPMKGKRPSTTYSRKDNVERAEESEADEETFEADTSLEVDTSTGKVMPIMDAKAKAEMRRLADRFREIDDYDMDFEEVTGSSSQMKDAR